MSKDSSYTHLHMHHPRLADVFEDFTRPHASSSAQLYPGSTGGGGGASGIAAAGAAAFPQSGDSAAAAPSAASQVFLPIEEIYVQPQYQPPNPEDEDDVVPDQHAAFGISRAMDRRREAVWRDLGLEELVSLRAAGATAAAAAAAAAASTAGAGAGAGGSAVAGGAASVVVDAAHRRDLRLRDAGARFGGRRVLVRASLR